MFWSLLICLLLAVASKVGAHDDDFTELLDDDLAFDDLTEDDLKDLEDMEEEEKSLHNQERLPTTDSQKEETYNQRPAKVVLDGSWSELYISPDVQNDPPMYHDKEYLKAIYNVQTGRTKFKMTRTSGGRKRNHGQNTYFGYCTSCCPYCQKVQTIQEAVCEQFISSNSTNLPDQLEPGGSFSTLSGLWSATDTILRIQVTSQPATPSCTSNYVFAANVSQVIWQVGNVTLTGGDTSVTSTSQLNSLGMYTNHKLYSLPCWVWHERRFGCRCQGTPVGMYLARALPPPIATSSSIRLAHTYQWLWLPQSTLNSISLVYLEVHASCLRYIFFQISPLLMLWELFILRGQELFQCSVHESALHRRLPFLACSDTLCWRAQYQP